jgi:hypothetical protein
MIERPQQTPGSGQRTARRRTPRPRGRRPRDAGAIPATAPRSLAPESEPNILGFPAEIAEEDDGTERPADGAGSAAVASDLGLVALRRSERIGGGALVLAGVAANMSLSLPWSSGEGFTGLTLVQRGVEVLTSGMGATVSRGVWQPLVVVLCGGLLVALGLLMLIPARAHRLLGVLALIVSLAAAAAVVVLMADGGWGADQFGPGMWCAVAVPVLGALGALKAMLTAPLVTLHPR